MISPRHGSRGQARLPARPGRQKTASCVRPATLAHALHGNVQRRRCKYARPEAACSRVLELSWRFLDLAKPSGTGFLEPPIELSGSRQGIGTGLLGPLLVPLDLAKASGTGILGPLLELT